MKFFLSFICTLLVQILPAQSVHQLRREGDKQYNQSKYREAEQEYRKATEQKTNDPALQYNLGNSMYQQGNYEAAEPVFDQASKTAKTSNQQADALHNLGNTYLKQHKFREAVEAYENSLRARPGDPDTKVNLQIARKKLRQQEQEQKEQQQQNQQNPNDQKQPQGQQPNEKQPNGNPEPKQPPQQPGDQQPPPQQEQQKNQQENSTGRMTPEQARRLLETAVAPADKRNARKYRELEPGKHYVKPKKDW